MPTQRKEIVMLNVKTTELADSLTEVAATQNTKEISKTARGVQVNVANHSSLLQRKRIEFETQKPLGLLSRIINTACAIADGVMVTCVSTKEVVKSNMAERREELKPEEDVIKVSSTPVPA